MNQRRVRILITTPLEPDLLVQVAGIDPRLEVIYPAELIAVPRYPADHTLPRADTPDLQERWRALLMTAEVLFDFGPATLAQELPEWPALRWIQATSAGVGQFAARSGLTASRVVVTTASGVHARPVAEFVLMAMLMFGKGAFRLAEDQRAHRWERYAGDELAGKVVGIVGVGRIGREVARIVRLLDAQVIGTVRDPHGRSADDLYLDRLLPTERLDDLLPLVDYLVLCVPQTPETVGMLSAGRLALLRREAVLINVARGAIVDEPALIAALHAGRLRGAALDVFAREPLPPESPLWDMSQVLVSPHSASTAPSENGKIVALFCDNLRRYLDGRPLRNVLDRTLLY
jgi:phosphoglycerate dehydrogenase-like enzyme